MAKRDVSIGLKVETKQMKTGLREADQSFKALGNTGKASGDQIKNAFSSVEKGIASTTNNNIKNINRMKQSMDSYARSVEAAKYKLTNLISSTVTSGGTGGGGGLGAFAGATGGVLAAGGFKSIAKMQDHFKSMSTEAAYAQAKMGLFSQESVAAAGTVGSLGKTLGAVAGKAGLVGLAITALTAILSTFALKGDALRTQQEAFENLSFSMGYSSNKIISDLEALSNHTISTADLMAMAGRSMLLGIPADKLDDLMQIARATMKITGQTAEEAFGDITLAVGRQSKMILDNLGILLDVDTANKNYAAQLGKTADQLTDSERKQAFLNETIQKGNKFVEQIGEKTGNQREGMKQLTTAWKNFVDAFSKAASAVFGPVINDLAKGISWLLQRFADAATIIARLADTGLSVEEKKITDINKLLDLKNQKLALASKYQNDMDDEYGSVRAETYTKQAEAIDEQIARIKLRQEAENLAGKEIVVLTDEQIKNAKRLEEQRLELAQQTHIRTLQLRGQEQLAEIEAVKQKYDKMFEVSVGNAQLEKQLRENLAREISEINGKYATKDRQEQLDKEVEFLERLEAAHKSHQADLDNIAKDAAEKEKEKIEDKQNMYDDMYHTISYEMGGAMNSIIQGTESWDDALRSMFGNLLSNLAQAIAQLMFFNMLQSAFGGGSGASAGAGAAGLIASAFTAAEGGITKGSFKPITAFASGGVATKPTLGMVAEAGESEAIIPLSKLPGIIRSAGGGGVGDVTINVNNTSGSGGNMSAEQAKELGAGVKNALKVLIRGEVGSMNRNGKINKTRFN